MQEPQVLAGEFEGQRPSIAPQRQGSVVNNPVEWLKQPEDVVPLALFLATHPAPCPTGQSFSLMRRTH